MKQKIISILFLVMVIAGFQNCGSGEGLVFGGNPANNPRYSRATAVKPLTRTDVDRIGGPRNLAPIFRAAPQNPSSNSSTPTPATPPSTPRPNSPSSSGSPGSPCPDAFHSCEDCLAYLENGPNNGLGVEQVREICIDKRRANNGAACWNNIPAGQYNWRHPGYEDGAYASPPRDEYPNHFHPQHHCLWRRGWLGDGA